MPDQFGGEFTSWTEPPAPPAAPVPPPRPPGSPGWGIRERPPREPAAWEAPELPSTVPGLAPLAPVPRPAAPAHGGAYGGSPSLGQPRPPAGAQSFPTTTQLIAAAVAACVLVVGLGVYLLRGNTSVPALSSAAPPGGAVAVVHHGPAVLTQESLSGGAASKTLSIPGSPTRITTTPDGQRAFLLDSSHGQVIPVDLVHGTVGTAIPAGKLPTDEAMSPDGTTLYVTDNLGGSVIAIDTASGAPGAAQQLAQGVTSFVPAPTGPTGVVSANNAAGQPGIIGFYSPTSGLGSAVLVGQNNPIADFYSPDGATVWVVEDGVGNLPGVVIPVDVRTHGVGRAIAVGHGPSGSTMTPDGHLLVVTNSIDRSVSIVDLRSRSLAATIAVGAGPASVEISADAGTAWIVCTLDRTLVPIDLHSNRVGKPVQLSNAPDDIVLPRAGGSAWVLFPSSAGSVTVVSGGTVGTPTPLGNEPGLLIAHDSSSAWAANVLSDTVQRVDLSGGRAGAPIRVPRLPSDLRLSHDQKTLFVLSFGDGSHDGFLTPIDTGSSTSGKPLAIGVAPSALTVAPDGSTAYIANHQNDSITVVDLRAWRVSAHIALPCSPTQLAETPEGATLYVDCSASEEVLPVTTAGRAVGAPITVGPSSTMVMGHQGKTIFVVAAHVLQEIDVATDKVVLSHDETGNIVSLAPTPDDSTLVAVENTGGAVLLLHSATLATTTSVSVGARPNGAQLSLDGTHAYVLDAGQQKLYVVDVSAAKVTSTLDVSPNAMDVVVPSSQ